MKVLIVVTLLFVCNEALRNELSANNDLNDEWQIYKTKYGKGYIGIEEGSRRLIWENNIKYIQKHNIRYDLGEHSYYLGVNRFADMTHDEFKNAYLRLTEPRKQSDGAKFMIPMNVETFPDTVNWVTKGYVTPVKNQGQCGSCWTFSTTGSLEGQYFRKNGNLLSFSEQQIVDCSSSFGTFGCAGGWMDDAFRYVQKYGIEQEKDYPYLAVNGVCKYNASKVACKVSGHYDVPSNDEKSLEAAVATVGPVSVAIDASGFQFYGGGIYDNPLCSTTALDHAVLVVGYDNNGQKYWLVKNSWGPKWGLSGYIKMSKDKNNQCGIAAKASYPIL